jgi:hypothetical protein
MQKYKRGMRGGFKMRKAKITNKPTRVLLYRRHMLLNAMPIAK